MTDEQEDDVHCVYEWNEQEQLSPVCFSYFSLCLTFMRLIVTSELPTAVRGRRLDFTVLYYGDTEKKKTHEKLEWPGSGLKVEMVS